MEAKTSNYYQQVSMNKKAMKATKAVSIRWRQNPVKVMKAKCLLVLCVYKLFNRAIRVKLMN